MCNISPHDRADPKQRYYRVYGSGPPRLLLHGLTNTWRVWRPFLTALAADHRLIVPDLRGHGRTTNAASELKPSQVAEGMFGMSLMCAYKAHAVIDSIR